MQRIAMIAILLGLAAVSALGCGGNQAGLPGAGWQSYHNSHLGLSISYPAGWDAIDITDTEVNFVPPMGQSSDGNVIVSVDDLSATMTLDEYRDQSVAQLKKVFTDFQSVELSATTMGTVSAYKIVYTYSLTENREAMQVFCIKDNKAYIFTYTVGAGQYANEIGTIQQMFDSLSFQ